MTTAGPVYRKFFVVLLAAAMMPALAQEQQGQPAQDIKYTAEEYAAYDRAVKEPDLAKREDAIVGFVKANPQSSLVQYAEGAFLELLQEYQKAGDIQRLAGAGEKFLALRPDHREVTFATGVAWYQLQQYQNAVGHLEKVYAAQQDPAVAYQLAIAYGALKNNDKTLQFGELACAKYEPKDCYQVLSIITRVLNEKKQWERGAANARKVIQAFEVVQKPPSASQAEWDEYVGRERAVAYSTIGRRSFERQDWAGAVSNFQQAMRSYSKAPGLTAEACYHIGLAYWRMGKMDLSMKAFARGSVQQGAPHAKPCRDQLEFLYKQDHNGVLDGLEEYLQRALNAKLW